jgi:AAA domain/Bifunctional DNA primase/polymerase, N-terminal
MAKGATPQEWAKFDMLLGLTEDLLPVVSDPDVQISPNSKMKAVGKTPSHINGQGFVSGFLDWTSYVATDKDIKRWSKEPRYGICLQTRHVRALDIDIDHLDAITIAGNIRQYISGPMRIRSNSRKFLVLFYLEGDYTKRAFKAQNGIVEFLATGQQCIVAGTHTSGARYEWPESFTEIPTITPEQFEALWAELVRIYAIENPTTTTTSKKETLNAAITSDPLAQHLIANNWVYSTERDGRLNIRCPNEHEHSGPSSESATVYYPANTGGYAQGHFDCKHAHCQHLTDDDFQRGVDYDDIAFDDVRGLAPDEDVDGPEDVYPSFLLHEYQGIAPQGYHIKGVIPKADMVMMYGATQSGKSFMAFDMAMAIARGVPWRDRRVTQGRVAYLIAEGAGGFGARITAYAEYHDVDTSKVPLLVVQATPNFLKVSEVKKFIRTLTKFDPEFTIIDTWAQVTSGGDENSGQDMGLALGHVRIVRKHTRGTVMLIHHTGKDAERGARGWSGMKGAADAELEVVRNNDDRVLSITKMKDGVEGAEFGFKLNVVTVGEDADGDDVTSCVVLPNEVSRAQVGMGKNERIVYEAARDGKGLDDVAPDVNTLLDLAINQIPYDPEVDKRDRRRDVVTRAYKKCLERGYLVEIEGRVECS